MANYVSTHTGAEIDAAVDAAIHFEAIYGTTTYAEIKAAFDAGRTVSARKGFQRFQLANLVAAAISFSLANAGTKTITLLTVTNADAWSETVLDIGAELAAIQAASSPAILNTASGAVCAFPDGSASPMTSVIAEIVASQAGSGDPAPDNIRPISGYTGANVTRAGRNMLNEASLAVYANWSKDLFPYGSYPTNSNSRGIALPVKAGATYMLSFGISGDSFPTYLYLCRGQGETSERLKVFTNTNFIDDTFSFTAEEGWLYYIRLGSMSTQSNFETNWANVAWSQMEIGPTAHAHEAYAGEVFNVSWQDEAGTVYGGNADAVNGAGQRTWAKVTLDSTIPAGTAGIRNISELADGVRFEYYPYRAVGSTTVNEMMSNKFAFGDTSTGTPFTISGASGSARMYLCLPAEYNTDALIRQWFTDNPADVVYPLETPESFAFTGVPIASLLGDNTLWNDVNGDTSATYRADTKLYIQSLLGA